MSTETSRIRVTDLSGVLRVEFVDKDILDEAAIRQISTELVKRVEAAASPAVVVDVVVTPAPAGLFPKRKWTR